MGEERILIKRLCKAHPSVEQRRGTNVVQGALQIPVAETCLLTSVSYQSWMLVVFAHLDTRAF